MNIYREGRWGFFSVEYADARLIIVLWLLGRDVFLFDRYILPVCPWCQNRWWYPPYDDDYCLVCDGDGRIGYHRWIRYHVRKYINLARYAIVDFFHRECPSCEGSGTLYAGDTLDPPEYCGICDGNGQIAHWYYYWLRHRWGYWK